MAGTVGTLKISLTAQTASFTGGMSQAADAARRTASDVKSAFDKVDFGESRAGIMLLEDSLGTKLPRHLNNLLTTLPGVGKAMELAFPVAAAAVLIEKVVEVAEKFGKLDEKLHEAQSAYSELAQGTERHAQSLAVENLRLADQLRILNGKPAQNGIVIAMEEARMKAEELTSQIQKAIGAEKELLQKQNVGFWQSLLGDTRTNDIVKPITDAKAGIAELEQQRGVALAAHDDAAAKSIQKELDLKRLNLAIWIQNQTDADDAARAEKIAKDVAANAAVAAAHVRTARASGPEAEAKMQAENLDFATRTNAAYATRAQLLSTALLELKAETEEEREQVKNAQLGLSIAKEREHLASIVDMTKQTRKNILPGGSFDGNGAFQDAATTKQLADQKLNLAIANELTKAHEFDLAAQQKTTLEISAQNKAWAELAALQEKDALADKEKELRLEEAFGIITKTQAETQIAVLYAAAEAKDLKDQNVELAKKSALLQQLNALTNGGTSGSDLDKAAYAKALADYQQFLTQKEKLREAAHTKEMTAAQAAAAAQHAMNVQTLGQITGALNSSVASWINGSDTFGQAFNKMWRGMASNAVMSLVEITEEQLIAWATQEALDEKSKLAHAKKAYGATYAATADIPIVGPELAPVAGAAAFAAVMAFERGGEVPDGHGGVPAMLHPREMVLDSGLADVVRNAANGGGGSNGNGSRPVSMTTHIHALAASADDITNVLEPHIKKVLRSEIRKGYRVI